MSAQTKKAENKSSDPEEIKVAFEREGLAPHGWGNEPRYQYGRHSHAYHKVLYCVSGSITFHTEDGDFELQAGDRLDVEPGTGHSATVGPEGVRCLEAARF